MPVEPVVPVDPLEPVVPVAPVLPVEPVAPVDPVEPVLPVAPVDPVEPVLPVVPVEPVVPLFPVVPMPPVLPVAAPEPATPALVTPPQPIMDTTNRNGANRKILRIGRAERVMAGTLGQCSDPNDAGQSLDVPGTYHWRCRLCPIRGMPATVEHAALNARRGLHPGCCDGKGNVQAAHKPNSVLDGHSSRPGIAAWLQQPTRRFRLWLPLTRTTHSLRLWRNGPLRSLAWRGANRLSCLFGLAPCGVYHATDIAAGAVGSYPTLSPLPCSSCEPPGGLLSVALAVPQP